MPNKPPRRLDFQVDGRTVYSQDVAEFVIERTKDGLLTVNAVEVGAKVLEHDDNPLIPPPPSPGAPDGADEPPAGESPHPAVLERVHTGEVYSQLPTGTALDGDVQVTAATESELITDTTTPPGDDDPEGEEPAGEDDE